MSRPQHRTGRRRCHRAERFPRAGGAAAGVAGPWVKGLEMTTGMYEMTSDSARLLPKAAPRGILSIQPDDFVHVRPAFRPLRGGGLRQLDSLGLLLDQVAI